MQVKHIFMEQTSQEGGNLFQLQNLYFTCSGTGLLLLPTSYKRQLYRKVASQVCFCKVASENGKKLLPEIFLSYQEAISLMDVFLILQLSANNLRVRTREENKNITINSNRSDILTLLTLLSVDAKSAVLCVLLRVPSLTKVEVCNFPLLHFPRRLYLTQGQLGMSLRRVKRLVIFKCQCLCLFDIQQRSVLS